MIVWRLICAVLLRSDKHKNTNKCILGLYLNINTWVKHTSGHITMSCSHVRVQLPALVSPVSCPNGSPVRLKQEHHRQPGNIQQSIFRWTNVWLKYANIKALAENQFLMACVNIRILSYQYSHSHWGDGVNVRCSLSSNMALLYWNFSFEIFEQSDNRPRFLWNSKLA